MLSVYYSMHNSTDAFIEVIMKIRIKNKWNDKDKVRTHEEIGSVLSFNFWKIASANVMHMENEGFQTNTHFQRLDVKIGRAHV